MRGWVLAIAIGVALLAGSAGLPVALAARDGVRDARAGDELPAGAPSAGVRSPDERSVDEWLVRLRDDTAGVRRTAVKGLAQHGTRAAWEGLLAALVDPEPEVADEAQVQLARLADPAVLAALYGRAGLAARDPWVRLRVAEAFGRMRVPVDAEELGRATRRPDAAVARAAAWSIERLTRTGHLDGEPERVARDLGKTFRTARDPGVRAAAWMALAEVDTPAAAALVERGLRERSSALRCAALAVAAQGGGSMGSDGSEADESGALSAARRGLTDTAVAVRIQAVRNLEARGDRPSAELLVERLEREDDARLALQVHAALQRISGMKYRPDPRPWRLWLGGLPEGWRAGPPASVTTASQRSRAALAGLPIVSERVCILIDLSGSIWREQADGRTRKSKVDELLRATLEALPETTRFNLIPYASEPAPWRERLAEARPRAVKEALGYFRELEITGRGNYYDAVQLALEDPDVDAIVVLSDGVPTGGRRWHLGLMVDLLAEQNRFRHVAFDAVLVDARPGTVRHWQRLAHETGGRCVTHEL